jgi:hypothetical protein
MQHRSGEKFGGDHTTFIELGASIADMLGRLTHVEKISPGKIQVIQGVGRNGNVVKIIDEQGYVLLKCVQRGSVQEIRVYTKKSQDVKLALAKWLRNNGIEIHFGEGQKKNR